MKVAQANVYGVLPESVLQVAHACQNRNHTVRVIAIHIETEEDNMASHQGATAMAEHRTGVRDELYDIVSVLYHALQGGETSMQYLQDAQGSGDQKLVQFFQEVQECHRHLATRAKEVLAQCLEHGNGRESQRGMDASAQGHGTTGSQAHGHSRQGREQQEHGR
jgi:hypothetical protein